ncbi:MAG: carbohydrate binding domain-containing protein [Thermoguttaceae bacterium]
MRTRCTAAVLVGLLSPPVAAAAQEPLFPFVVAYDCSENVTNVSGWLDRPAGKHGFVRAAGGRLVTDAGPMRFWATNLCFEACFPERKQAERVAARLARLGINCVRMHHMDSYSIWGASPNKLTIDPKKLDQLDYLIYQLKEHGIYVNLNLHVSRWFGDAEGFPHRDQRPNYDKGLDNFEPRMIELQKRYARDLLTHVNPYTKTPYTDEPAVAFVEISNEDALFAVWGRGQLDRLPEPYATTFRKLWNAWLRKKYGSTDKLRRQWNAGAQPLGDEMLKNGDFSRPPEDGWRMERDARTEVTWSTLPGGPAAGRLLRVAVKRQGEVPWRPQFSQSGLPVRKGSAYTLAFQARAEQPGKIAANCMMAHEPWENLGFSASFEVGPQWQSYRFTFLAEQDDANARVTLSSLGPGTYEFAGFSLRPGGIIGLEEGQRLEDASVPVLRRSDRHLPKPAQNDFMDFLWDTEAEYWWGMYRYLKEDLRVRALVAGTQIGYSPPHVQAALDYVDAHSYWQHPVFPGRPWDPRNWYVRNVALVNNPGGTLARLASTRVAGKPYTVSEYNHPLPNAYAAEGFPMIAAMGALQGWDGIYSFAYCHNRDFELRRLDGYFDIKSDPTRLVHMPACAALFLRGDASPANRTILAPLPKAQERQKLHQTQSARTLTSESFGVDPRLALVHAIGLDLGQQRGAGSGADNRPAAAPNAVVVSETGQIRWDLSQPGAGYFFVDTPRTKLFTGFVRGREFRLGELTLRIGPTRLDWATVSLVSIEGDQLGSRPGRVLIAATGVVQNTGAQLEDLGEDRITLRNRWGTEPVLCEGIPAAIVLPVAPQRVRLFPLDEAGNRRAAIRVSAEGGRARIELAPRHRTLWYELEIR